jgi:O-antigen ligase
MARKHRPGKPGESAGSSPAPLSSPQALAALPAEVVRGDATVPLLALMMFLAPALGVPHEEMLQDTLKSIVVSFLALLAALLLLWQQRARREPLRWHAVLWLPLALMAYALGSMAWSHTYLGGVEAVRWFVFTLIAWLALNTLARDRLPLLAWGVHAGAVVASLWTALQFWVDFRFFPQGPNPASTFVNRNFFAEFAVCTLPFTALLLARARQSAQVALIGLTGSLVIVAILMTGTRAALAAMWLQLLLVLPLIAWRCRGQLAFGSWSRRTAMLASGVVLAGVVGLGLIPSGNQKILEEGRGSTALERGFKRTQSIRTDDSSLGLRVLMWKATLRVVQARPLSGVGAGAWESDIPLYQEEGAQLETDYYVHNEYLQLVAEYGLVGWAFLLLLAAWLLRCAWAGWRARTAEELAEMPGRAVLLAALLALFIVSNVGFPWRMATTGALFAICLGALAASEARLGTLAPWAVARLRWSPRIGQAATIACLACLALAMFITQRAAESERKIVQAARVALTITQTGDYHNPRWEPAKREMLQLVREGIAINPHYRKITPMVADELARWGDWKNAVWIWDSVLGSRPYVVAILCNVARGYAATGEPQKAWTYLERARHLQPRAPVVRSLEVILLARTGQELQALDVARRSIAQNVIDYDLVNSAFILGWRNGDHTTALRAMQLRMQHWPETRAAAYVQLGNFYATAMQSPAKALQAFRQGLELAGSETQRSSLKAQIPAEYLAKLAAQTSESSK